MPLQNDQFHYPLGQPGDNWAQEQQLQPVLVQQADLIANWKKAYNTIMKASKKKSTEDHSTSQLSGEYRALEVRIEELRVSIHQESGELARVIETISTQVEVVKDIGSIILHHLANLQRASSQLERARLNLPPLDSLDSETKQVEARWFLGQAPQPVEAGEVQFEPELLPPDQG